MTFIGPIVVRVTAYPGFAWMRAWISASLDTRICIPDRANDVGLALAGGADPGQVEQAMAGSLEGANRGARHVKYRPQFGDKKRRTHASRAEF